MRTAAVVAALIGSALAGCGGLGLGALGGDLGGLGGEACAGYDLNGDGTTTVQEVQGGWEMLVGTSLSTQEATEFVNTYCQ